MIHTLPVVRVCSGCLSTASTAILWMPGISVRYAIPGIYYVPGICKIERYPVGKEHSEGYTSMGG